LAQKKNEDDGQHGNKRWGKGENGPQLSQKWVPWNALVRIGPSGPFVTGEITHAEHLNSFFLEGFSRLFPSFSIRLI
jgi:hypothetical protein